MKTNKIKELDKKIEHNNKIKKRINKIKELKLGYKLIICIAITIIVLICSKLIINNIENKEKNFDYSKVYALNGTITKSWYEYDWPDVEYSSMRTLLYIEVSLETGETRTVEVSGSKEDYLEGDSIVLYTDGTWYETRPEAIAAIAQLSILDFLVCCCMLFLVIAVWCFLFGWKGVIVAVLIIVITYSTGEL